MAVKGKRRQQKTRKTRRKTKSNTRRQHHAPCQRGGNYERDATTRTLEGTPTKPLNKMVVTVPGHGTMSGSAYYRMMEDLDRNGNDFYA